MKKQLLLFVLMLLPMLASAAAVEVDGIYYKLNENAKTAEVTENPNMYSGEVVIPASVIYETVEYNVTAIGTWAFTWCSDLTSITIPNSIASIGGYAFAGCSGLTSITIPNSVTKIVGSAFQNCTGLTSITIPNSVTSITSETFKGCTGLTSVTIPNSVTEICADAFSGCTGLTSITIPNSVTYIDYQVFKKCSALKTLNIGSGIETILDGAFDGCSMLTEVYCYAENVPYTNNGVFKNSSIESATLHVPDASLNAYKTTEPWSQFGTIVALTDDDPKPTGIENVNINDNDNERWYSLDGQQLQVMPTQKGVYIVNGRKVVIK